MENNTNLENNVLRTCVNNVLITLMFDLYRRSYLEDA